MTLRPPSPPAGPLRPLVVGLIFFVACVLFSLAATAQPHALPGETCAKCLPPNTDLRPPSPPSPLTFVGRFVDSVNTRNVQNIGMRTVRAQRVRVVGDRILVEYGETVAAFGAAQFLDVIRRPLSPVGVMNTGSKVSRYGDPIERVAKPSTFLYPEAAQSGWVWTPQDVQASLSDFDGDGSGNVVAGTAYWGWGIARDDNPFPDTRHMEFRSQVMAPIAPASVIYLAPFVVISSPVVSSRAASLIVYDVTDTRRPRSIETRYGREHGIVTWARSSGRVAVVNSDGRLRFYDVAGLLAGTTPLLTVSPAAGKTFRGVTFDENGVLWAIESTRSVAAGNRVWRIAPSGTGHEVRQLDIGAPFAAACIAARRGIIALGGYSQAGAGLRLYRADAGLRFLDTGDFFHRFYHSRTPPSAGAYNPSYTALAAVNLIEHGGKLFLIYSAEGLGDVYEIAIETPRTGRGDANGDGAVNAADVFFMVNALFAGGPAPIGDADVNGDGAFTVADLFILIEQTFGGEQ